MSRETWLLVVKVARQKLAQMKPLIRRPKRETQRPVRCVREDHYVLLLATGY